MKLLRPLLRAPGFTAAALAVIALATGANTAIFSLVYSVVLRPLPFPDPAHLYSVTQYYPAYRQSVVPSPVYLDWHDRVTGGPSSRLGGRRLAAYSMGDYTFSSGDLTERLPAAMVTSDFFTVLGVGVARASGAGRLFTPADDRPGADPVALVREGFPAAPGAHITLDGRPYTVAGTLPAGFQFPPGVQVWVPLALDPVRERSGGPMELVRVIARWDRGDPASDLNPSEGARLVVTPLQTWLTANTRRVWFVLLAAVGLVLLIACANVAGLLIARGATRRREMAIRLALGAPAGHLARGLLGESLVLAAAGSALGLALAAALLHALLPLIPASWLAGRPVQLDAPVFAFTAAVALAAALLFGAAPAREAARVDMAESLKQAVPTATSPLRLRRVLVTAEIALSLTLLSAAGLMVRSFSALSAVSPGFVPQGVLSLALNLPDTRHQAFLDAALEQAASLPGVSAAGLASALPFAAGGASRALISAEGEPPWGSSNAERHRVESILVGGDYFRALGIPVLDGRAAFSGATSGAVSGGNLAVINETLARRFFGTTRAAGRRLKVGLAESPAPWLIVAGVVGDSRRSALDDEIPATLYRPYQQANGMRAAGLVLRSGHGVESAALSEPLRRTLAGLDRSVAVSDVQTMESRLSASMASPRLRSVAASLLAGLALLIGMTGLYGVLSYMVSQRAAEMGVRIALGATPGDIFGLVVGQALALAGVGVVVGLGLSLATARFLGGLLFHIAPSDPWTLAGAALAMLAVAAAAALVPARRATRTDPIRCLRQE